MSKRKKIYIYTDGGARGNPGPAAIGVVIKSSKGDVLKTYGETIGIKTNNEAEYAAVVFGLKKIKQLFGKEQIKKIDFEVRMDSELVASQLNGTYRIKNENLCKPFIDIWNLKIDIRKITFTYIPRSQNKEADRVLNEALDMKRQDSLI